MKKNTKKLLLLLAILRGMSVLADNPVVQTIYTADPAPLVYNDTVFLYTGHDEDGSTYYTMNNWRVFSTTDMVNWVDRGTPLSCSTFSWAKQGEAWAAQCISRNGKFYWYVTVTDTKTGLQTIGVAVSNTPTGPFVDAIGKALVTPGWGIIDPTVFIDDDGQAYLYYGNNNLWYIKLNANMISTSGSQIQVDVTNKSAFGPDFEEGPWFYKRNGIYYLAYAAGGVPEHIAYSTSNSPVGPWVYRDTIMPVQGGSFTNHCGIVDFKGHSYFVYHNGALAGGGGFTRSVCVEEFKYNTDGTIPTFNMTKAGPTAIKNLNPYSKTEAETIGWESGVETAENSTVGVYVTDIDNGDYIKVNSVDFGTTGAGVFKAKVATTSKGGSIEIRLDGVSGALVGKLNVSNTGGQTAWKEESCAISGATGVHNLFFVFKGITVGDLYNFDSWQFTEKKSSHELVALNAYTGSYKLDISNGSNTTSINVNAVYSDGVTVDVTNLVQYTADKEGVISIDNGILTGISYSPVKITASYNGKSDVVNMLIIDAKDELTVSTLTLDTANIDILTGDTLSYKLIATYKDGHTVNVTTVADVSNSATSVATVAGGLITTKAGGTAEVTFSFKGDVGIPATATMNLNVQTFPLTSQLFNPSIYSTGTFTQSTSGLKTGTNGFGGWHYPNGIDISSYKYLVANLKYLNSKASFRLFDEDSYSSIPAVYNFSTTSKQIVVPLANMKKTGTTTVCDPSHIYYAGFWSPGGTVIYIQDVYLTNSDTYEKPSAVETITADMDKYIDVYTTMGVRLYTHKLKSEVMRELRNGLYIIGNQKILINK